MDHRDEVRAAIEHAIACYGADLTLAVAAPAAARVAAPASPGAAANADVAPATTATRAMRGAALVAMAREVAPCTACKLAKARTQVVFGEGDPAAAVMFVGEAPGREEDRQGRPFVGAAGQLLDKIIVNAMGLARGEVYIANVNKCRPPGNRDPEADEVAACLPYLRRQIELIQPRVIVTLGRVATWNLLGVSESMGRLRGRELRYGDIPVIPTWHPAYLLRTPSAKADTWEDIKKVNRLLGRPEVPPRPAAPDGHPS